LQKREFTIEGNRPLTSDIFELTLEGDTGAIVRPGQFVNIALRGFFLRRPISVCDWSADRLTLIVKQVGLGTAYMAARKPGETLDLLTGLGNGFDPERSGDAPLLVGGGAGVPPLYGLAKDLRRRGVTPRVILGFQTAGASFYTREFADLGCAVTLMTADGSLGGRGFVTEAMQGDWQHASYLYTCGPLAMLRAVYDTALCPGEYSFEERMGCGFGACMGCSCQTKYGDKRLCREGPVLRGEEIVW
jgi:dihydroorotate dehydrogenase electron transfer subunit